MSTVVCLPCGPSSSGDEIFNSNVVESNETWNIVSGYEMKLSPDLDVQGTLNVVGILEIY